MGQPKFNIFLRHRVLIAGIQGQGSVAKPDRSGENIKDHFVANCLPSLPVKEFRKLVNIWQRYRKSFVACF